MNDRNFTPDSRYAVTKERIFPITTKAEILTALEYSHYLPEELKEEFDASIKFITEGNIPKYTPKEVDESVIGTENQWIIENFLEDTARDNLSEISGFLSLPSKNRFLLEYIPDLDKWFNDQYKLDYVMRSMQYVYKLELKHLRRYKSFINIREENFELNTILIEDLRRSGKYDKMFKVHNIYLGVNYDRLDIVLTLGNNRYLLIPVYQVQNGNFINNLYNMWNTSKPIKYKILNLNKSLVGSGIIDEVNTFSFKQEFDKLEEGYRRTEACRTVDQNKYLLVELLSRFTYVSENVEKVKIAKLFNEVQFKVKKTDPAFQIVNFVESLPYWEIMFDEKITSFKLKENVMKINRLRS